MKPIVGLSDVERRTLDRRQFSVRIGASAVAVLSSPALRLLADISEANKAAAVVAGKDPRLIVHSNAPIVLETPLELLGDHGVTPLDRLFVRNCQNPEGLIGLQSQQLKGWKIALTGLIDREITIDASALESLEQTEYEMVLQCSGNSRSKFAAAGAVSGTPWGSGGMGNVRFAGVLVRTLLEKHGISPQQSARFIAAEGNDVAMPGKDDFEHSLPLGDVLDRSILAIRLNGQPLAAVHGGPVRLVTPGVYGTMNVKWLRRLRFEQEESRNTYQVPQYRVPLSPIEPGKPFENDLTNSRSNWDMKIRSVILSPAAGARLRAGKLRIRGVAFNDGKAPIETVLVSQDEGQSWERASLEKPQSRYAWTQFSHDVQLQPGQQSVWTRAVDAWGRSQPLDGTVFWNPHGYEWNGVDKVRFVVV